MEKTTRSDRSDREPPAARTAAEAARGRILLLLEKHYPSDAAFERDLRLAPKTVDNWRRGRSCSFMRLLPEMAERFGVNVGELLAIPVARDTSELSEEEAELVNLYRKTSGLSAQEREQLRRVIADAVDLSLAAGKAWQKKRRARAAGGLAVGEQASPPRGAKTGKEETS